MWRFAVARVTRTAEPRPLALPAVALAAALWASGAVVARNLFDAGVTPLQLVAARSVITALGLALVPTSWRPGGRVSKAKLVVLGTAIALVNGTYYVSIERLPVAIAIVLQYTAPALVVAWTTLCLRRRPGRAVVAALVAALAGVVIVTDALDEAGSGLDPLGVAMGLGAALSYATYTLVGEDVRRALGAEATLVRAFAVASLIWVVTLAPLGWPAELFAARNLPGVLYVGVGATLVPFVLYVWAIGHVRAERAAIAATLEPVLAALAAWAWLGQTLRPTQLAGGALVVVAVVVVQTAPGARARPPAGVSSPTTDPRAAPR